jgi:hypothetical protein
VSPSFRQRCVRNLVICCRDALASLDLLWDELFPAEQARIVQPLVERADI